MSEYDANYSAASLDEAYLDLTDHLKQRIDSSVESRTFLLSSSDEDLNEKKIIFGTDIEDCVKEIRHRIYLKTKLTASAGIACNLRLAKLCSGKLLIFKNRIRPEIESYNSKIMVFVSIRDLILLIY